MTMQSATRSSDQPLGVGRDLRRRLLFHHAPLALASTIVLFLFMVFPLFDSGMTHGGSRMMHHGGHHGGAMSHGAKQDTGVDSSSVGIQGHMRSLAQLTTAIAYVIPTGYVALGLIGLTLLIGPANLLLSRRLPVSTYLCRDVGAWAAIFSGIHVVALAAALQTRGGGNGLIAMSLHLFLTPDGRPLTNSFGLGNWTGLIALLIVLGLLAISNDFALRKLKAKFWKGLQRMNYTLFGLVILHAFFYGAFLRMKSPFTLLLGVIVFTVFLGQTIGIWLWRRKYIFKARITSEAEATD